jgi:hypothetical protein
MMRKTGCLILAVSVALVAVGLSRADDRSEAMALIDKAIKASGGEAKLAKFNAQSWREKGTYYGMGNGLPYTGVYVIQRPDKFSMEIEGAFKIVLNGDKGWIKSGDGAATEMTKEQLAEQKEEQYTGWVTSLLPLKEKGYTLTPLPEIKVDNRPAVGVKVAHEGHRDVKLYFDKETALPAKTEATAKDLEQGGKEVNQEAYYSNYKEVEGAQIPMKVVIKRDGKLFVEAENSDVKPAGKLDDKVFAKP